MNNSFFALITPYERIFILKQTIVPNNNVRKYLAAKKQSKILDKRIRSSFRDFSSRDKRIYNDISSEIDSN
jgi:hypothetical protein